MVKPRKITKMDIESPYLVLQRSVCMYMARQFKPGKACIWVKVFRVCCYETSFAFCLPAVIFIKTLLIFFLIVRKRWIIKTRFLLVKLACCRFYHHHHLLLYYHLPLLKLVGSFWPLYICFIASFSMLTQLPMKCTLTKQICFQAIPTGRY